MTLVAPRERVNGAADGLQESPASRRIYSRWSASYHALDRSSFMRTTLVASVAFLVFGLTGLGQTSVRVPAGLVDAAGTAPGILVHYLVEASIPAGIELQQSDMPLTFPPKLAVDGRSTIPAAELSKAFNERHTTYRAEIVDGVFVIRPVARRASYLDQAAPPIRLHVRGIMAATRKLFAPLDPRLDAAGPRVGTPVGGVDLEGEAVDIDTDTAGKSVLNVLNAIVNHAPGRAWLALTTDQETTTIGQIGFIRANAFSLLPISGRR